jgi:hypothetical protein
LPRLVTLEKKPTEERLVLTEPKFVDLERQKDNDIACGKIETGHAGYLRSQDTFGISVTGLGRV